MIDIKSIEKTLPMLNEIGVEAITFIYCDRSQKQFKIDMKRVEKILLNSSQQCGRSQMMNIDIVESIEYFLNKNPDAYMLNFSNDTIDSESKIETVVVGCEGGFTDNEIKLFNQNKIIGLNTPLILRSETATVSLSSNLLL